MSYIFMIFSIGIKNTKQEKAAARRDKRTRIDNLLQNLKNILFY